MFRRFFAAVSAMTTAAESLAGSLAEANSRFRANVLDGPETPALPEPAEAEPAEAEVKEESQPRNGRRVKA